MPDSYTNLLYHIIFSTKDRCPFLTDLYQARLYDYIGGTIRGLGGISLELNGTEDHLHLLTKLRPDTALSDVLRDLKANASGCISRGKRVLLAAWLWGVYGKSIECSGGTSIHCRTEGTSSKDFVSR